MAGVVAGFNLSAAKNAVVFNQIATITNALHVVSEKRRFLPRDILHMGLAYEISVDINNMSSADALAIMALTFIDPNPVGVIDVPILPAAYDTTSVGGAGNDTWNVNLQAILMSTGYAIGPTDVNLTNAPNPQVAITQGHLAANVFPADWANVIMTNANEYTIAILMMLLCTARNGQMNQAQIDKAADCIKADLNIVPGKRLLKARQICAAAGHLGSVVNNMDVFFARLIAQLNIMNMQIFSMRFVYSSRHGLGPLNIITMIISEIRNFFPVQVPYGTTIMGGRTQVLAALDTIAYNNARAVYDAAVVAYNAALLAIGGVIPANPGVFVPPLITITADEFCERFPDLGIYSAHVATVTAWNKLTQGANGINQVNLSSLLHVCVEIGIRFLRISNLSSYTRRGGMSMRIAAITDAAVADLTTFARFSGATSRPSTAAQVTAAVAAIIAMDVNAKLVQ